MIEQLDPYIGMIGKRCIIETQAGIKSIAHLIHKEGNNLIFATDLVILKKKDILKISIKEK